MDDMKKKVTASAISQVMAELGKRGGSVSGVKKGVATLSNKERS